MRESLSLYRFPFQAMGSPCEVQLYACDAEEARRFADVAVADVTRLEQRYSRFRDDSLLSTINRVAAAGGTIALDAETASLIDYADTCYRQSDGLFDITSGILRRAWRFREKVLPTSDEIAALLDHIGWDKVRWEPPTLAFQPGMELDLGGVVKEYAADRVAASCFNAGARHGIVNLGGDVRIIGARPDGAPWRIGIQHPRERDAAIATLTLHSGAVASSGDYERCVVVEGVRYGHVLNPKSGWPVKHLASVTVVGELCVVAGSASTIAMLKEEAGPAWLESMGLPCYWIDVEGRIGGSLAHTSV